MNDQPTYISPASAPVTVASALPYETGEPAPRWHLGWAVGVVAAGAGLEAGLGAISWPTLLALATGAAPGLVGYLWRSEGSGRRAILALWAVAMAVAAGVEGGLTGPLGLWCAMPILAGALTGATAEGAVMSAAAIAVTVLVETAGVTLPAPRGLFGLGVSAVGLLTIGGAAVGALAILGARHRQKAQALAQEAERLRGVISELPRATHAEGGSGAPAADAVELERLQGLLHEQEDDVAKARARIAALEQKLRTTELARNTALNSLTDASAAREQAEANATGRTRFLANMSHELRTPLNAIMGFSDIMRARMFGDLPPRYAEYAELIHESGRHLTDLINDVLDMSKIEADRYSLSREMFDAREAISAAIRLVRLQADDAGVTLRGLSPAEPLMVDADRRALKQIVLNLVSNALKFTPRGGSVTVTVQRVRGALELVVSDTGVGIAKADLERLGRPFEQVGDSERKAQGTGLGLSLVKAFAGLHGGSMHIESALGEGVAVTVRLPVLLDAGEPAPEDDDDDGPVPGAPPPRMGQVIPLNLNC